MTVMTETDEYRNNHPMAHYLILSKTHAAFFSKIDR